MTRTRQERFASGITAMLITNLVPTSHFLQRNWRRVAERSVSVMEDVLRRL